MVRQATAAAVSASISTPVGPVTSAVAVTLSPGTAASGSISTATLVSSSGWQSGISSCVFLAAMIPAMRAAPSTSPLRASPARIVCSVAGRITTVPSARARRRVSGLSATSTMRASPASPRWVSVADLAMPSIGLRVRRTFEQSARGRPDIGLAHQALADQKGADAGAQQPPAIIMREDAALAHQQPVARHHAGQPFGGAQADLEGAEVAVVDADQLGAELQCPLHL